jgi:hypothetical protein
MEPTYEQKEAFRDHADRTPEDVDAWEPCRTCGRPIEWHGGMPPGPSGYWEHVDASEGADCADRRGDAELAPALEGEMTYEERDPEECAECGHEHWFPEVAKYGVCPVCSCSMDDGYDPHDV